MTAILLPGIAAILRSTFASKVDLDTEKNRITTLENKVDSLPSAKEFYNLSERLVDVAGDVKAINVGLTHITKGVDLLTEAERRRKE